ncbi:MAG: hypothetical protein IPG50_19185 [Myxococcales bacterium]|nr:hypothetical protein [Myxococcales bacterium]
MRKRIMLTVLLATAACGHEAEKASGRAGGASLAPLTTTAAAALRDRLRTSFRGVFPQSTGDARIAVAAAGWSATPNAPPSGGWSTSTAFAAATLPTDAAKPFRVEGGGAAIAVRLRGLETSGGALVDGDIVYASTLNGSAGSYVQHPHAHGTEDFLLLEQPLPSSAVEYEVSLERGIAGVRVVEGTVEFLTESGTPALRMAKPSLETATGAIVEPDVQVSGCAVDRDPRAPWGRSPVPPGSSECVVRLDWSKTALTYPALVDPAWVATGTMIGATRRDHAASVLRDGRVLVSGGRVGTTYNASAILYDPTSRTWANTGALKSKLGSHTSTTLPDGKVLVAGGYNQSVGSGGPYKEAEIYDPALGTWTLVASMVSNRYQHTATVLSNGKVLIAGGGETVPLGTTELYTPATNTWTAGPAMAVARWLHRAEALPDGRILVAGGYTGSAYSASAQLYNPTANTWATTGSLATGRADFSLNVLASGLAFVVGGTNAAGSLASTELYNVYTGVFSGTAPALAAPRAQHRAVTLSPEQILVVGGKNGATSLATTVLYNVDTNTWTADANLPAARDGHVAVALQRGGVLSAGAGGAETWGGRTTEGESAIGIPVKVEWLPVTGVRTAADLLSVRITNMTSASKSVTLKVEARGLDDRESIRTVGTYTVGTTPLTVTMPVGNLPVQSVGTQSMAGLTAEYTHNSVSAFVQALPIFYQFAAGFGSATFYGATQNSVPDLDPYTTFGSSGGEVILERGAFATQLKNAVEPVFSLAGQVWDAPAGVFRPLAELGNRVFVGGTTHGMMPLDHKFFSDATKIFVTGAAPAPESGPTYYLCGYWAGKFTDSGYGEDNYRFRVVEHSPASWARASIVKRSTGILHWRGVLDANGCALVPLAPSSSYILTVTSRMAREVPPAPTATLTASYRTGTSGTRTVFPASMRFGATETQKAVISSQSLAFSYGFTTAASAGIIEFRPWMQDTLTRTLIVLARSFADPTMGVVDGRYYRAYGDLGCEGSVSEPACYSPTKRSFYVGPAPDTVHDSFFKFVVGHEFGHNIASFRFGNLGFDYDVFASEPSVLCNCQVVGSLLDGGTDAYIQGNRRHCLTSKEEHSAAQGEGYGHFTASRLWNDLSQSTGGCTFVYYKEAINDLGGGNTSTDPIPVARSCDGPVKWLDNKCGGADGGAGSGVEWDWLNFFVAVNRGLDKTEIAGPGRDLPLGMWGRNDAD